MSGIADVLTRISAIETMIEQVAAGPAGLTTSTALGGAELVTSGTSTSVAATTSTTSSADLFARALVSAGTAATTTPTASTAPTTTVQDTAGTNLKGDGSVTGADLVAAARKYLGVPYVWGGTTASGLDCSGLVKLSLNDLGLDITRTARQQGTEGEPVASLAEAKPGDLLIFNGGTHVGIYTGGDLMIDAPRPGKFVNERQIYETPTAIRRILPSAEAAPVANGLTVPAATDLAALLSTSDSQRLALALLTGAAA